MFSVHERWTTYDGRDGISGSRSLQRGSYATFAAAEIARNDLIEEIGSSYGEVDAFIADADGNHVHSHPITTVYVCKVYEASLEKCECIPF